MGRRNGGLQVTLRRRLESCKSKYSSAEEIVNHLRSTYPDYHRTKYQTLIRFVHDALHSTANENDHHDEDDDDDDESQKTEEALHIRRRRRKSMQVPSTSSDSASESSGDDGAVSEESSFDLMKTMLRNSYTGTKAVVPMAEEEKNVELEMGSNTSKAATTILVNVDGVEAKSSVSNGGGDGVKVKRKKEASFKDFGGMKEILDDLKWDLMLLGDPELPREVGVRPITGILLHGPPGCGKTRLAHAIANETGFSFHSISSTEVVSGVSGASEENIRELFSKAKRTAPSIVFIDEIDAIASKRENLQREMEKRIVTQLITCMDESDDSGSSDDDEPPGSVLVIGATNRVNAIDPALRRPGRFDREFFLGVPDESAREEILSVLARSRNLKLDGSIDMRKIARSTPGFVGADLTALADKAGRLAIERTKRELSQDPMSEPDEDWWRKRWLPEERKKVAIKMSDFEEAAKMVQPSSKRDGFSTIPDVKWEDVGAHDLLREEFYDNIIRPIKYPEDYEELGMDLQTGFLLYGPPGCGKTLIAKAVANEAGANFIQIMGPELLNKFVGESELAVRTLFSNARTNAPCIIFFDEVDALTTERGKEGGRVIEGVLNQLLVELDGAEKRRGVFVIGATNRPEVMDRAILRPGRFGKHLYVPLPSPDDRVLILKALARKRPVDASVDLSAIGRMKACENLSGADLAELMRVAGMAAVKEKTTSGSSTIKTSHFEVALSKVSPSVSDKQRQYYQHLSKSLKAA